MKTTEKSFNTTFKKDQDCSKNNAENIRWLKTRKIIEATLVLLIVSGCVALFLCYFAIIDIIPGGSFISNTVGIYVTAATAMCHLILFCMSTVPWTPLKFDHVHIMERILTARDTCEMKRTANLIKAERKKLDSYGEEFLKYITEGPGNDGEGEEFRRNVEDKYCSIARRAQLHNERVKASNEERKQELIDFFSKIIFLVSFNFFTATATGL